jgi:hypothetical protein
VSVADLRRNSSLRNNNSQSWCCSHAGWSVLMTMAVVSDDAVHLARCGMLRASPIAMLDATTRRVFVTYCPGSCHGHRCCMWTDGLKNITFSLPLTLKTICCFLRWNEKKWLGLGWYRQSMFNIQCEDLMMLRFSNTKLSMLDSFLVWVKRHGS